MYSGGRNALALLDSYFANGGEDSSACKSKCHQRIRMHRAIDKNFFPDDFWVSDMLSSSEMEESLAISPILKVSCRNLT